MSESLNIVVTLKTKTCSCGLVYAVPHWVERGKCPMCAERLISEANEKCEEAWEICAEKDRAISSLRGVITKLKKQK